MNLANSVVLSCVLLSGASLHAQEISADKTYPRFQVGVTGIWATIEPGFRVTVADTEPRSAAAPVLEKGDVLVSVRGVELVGPDPRVALGRAIGAAEGSDGKLKFTVNRSGVSREVVVEIPVLGPLGKAWPRDCEKSTKIVRQTAEFVVKSQQKDGSYKLGKQTERDGLAGCLVGLFLLSTGEPQYLPAVRLQVRKLAENCVERPTGSTWHLGYQGILLGEYYLRTGDKTVLAGLASLCAKAGEMQAAGAWGHGPNMNPGYVQSGQINSAGVPILTTLILARECGVTVDEAMYLRALTFFYRMAGHGCVCYGDHRSELFPNTNGRNGMLACAFALLEGEAYQKAAQHLALVLADSYYAPEFGHTGGGFNVMWRGLGSVHVPGDRQDRYRRQLDELAWYYDLCRLPTGGFSMLPTPPTNGRYCGTAWGTGTVALTYAAPLRTLRITGAPRTKYSVAAASPQLPWGRPADLLFLGTDDCEGYGDELVEPREVHARLRGRDTSAATTEFCAKQMRHNSPLIRTWAARVLADRADAPSIRALADAARHSDPRVRRAAFDGISGYDNWGRPTAPNRYRGKVPPAVVSKEFVPAIERTLRDRQAAWWEIDGALFALGRAKPADIRRNMATILAFARHEEWYLREGAFWAIVGLHATITGEEFQSLADIYAGERHVFARSSYDAGVRHLLRGDKIRLDPDSQARAVKTLGQTLHSAPIAHGYGTSGKHEAAHRTMMVLEHFDPAVYGLIVDDFVKYLGYWTPDYQHSEWLITGSPWQRGLVKIAAELGADAEPLVASFRKCLAERVDEQSRSRAHKACAEALQKAIAEFDAKFARSARK